MTTPDVSDVKAGKYELVATSWDEPTSKPGDPFSYKRHRRGDIVTLNDEEARRLVRAGAVVKPGERERGVAEQLAAQAQAAQRAYEEALRKAAPEPQTSAAPSDPSTMNATATTLAGPFDPGAHDVKEVQAYLASADDAERGRVLAAERAGKNRSSLLQ
jgi:hypothetical protein